ncbi:MAG: histidinol dehydrogenase, partial [Crocinitomicaceae bacterium]|nr:histidinol dehydrogenase [Crocinitomicaceae bacterium]
MKTIINPIKSKWSGLCKRPSVSATEMNELVTNIFQTVKILGDSGVRGYTKQFDKVEIKEFKCSELEIENGIRLVNEELKAAIRLAATNIRTFHEKQIIPTEIIETTKGV